MALDSVNRSNIYPRSLFSSRKFTEEDLMKVIFYIIAACFFKKRFLFAKIKNREWALRLVKLKIVFMKFMKKRGLELGKYSN